MSRILHPAGFEQALNTRRLCNGVSPFIHMRFATGEVNWWPEAFPCRAAIAAVGLATRNYFPGKHKVLFLSAFCISVTKYDSPCPINKAVTSEEVKWHTPFLGHEDANSKPPSPSLSKAAAA
ncbi:hypothetical protein QJQ45_019617 [Haematococcus lacustris]|nr:hypothetical protein QJQ45_019617 [Haematococcus lacustris]